MVKEDKNIDLKKNLTDLAEIVKWFDDKKDVDLDASLEKVREAAKIIKESRARIQDVENSFKEIEKDLISDDEKPSEPEEEMPF
jgi:exonuclease VII small subunit